MLLAASTCTAEVPSWVWSRRRAVLAALFGGIGLVFGFHVGWLRDGGNEVETGCGVAYASFSKVTVADF